MENLKVKKDWEIKKLGDVCEIYQPQTISTKQLIENGKYSVYGANGIIGNYDKYNHEESEVLLTCRGATCGSVNISEPFSWINGNAMVIHPKSTDISKQFLTFILCSLDYSHIITGAAQPQITRQTLSPTLIPVPPLEEQKRIVKILDEKFAQLETIKTNAQTNLQNANDLFQSQLTKAFSNTTWEKKRLGDVCEIRPSKSETTKYLSDDDNVSFLPMEDLQIMNYYIEPKQSKRLKEVSGSYTCFANGDVLLAKVTPCFENGKQGIAKDLENGVGFGSSEYIVFRPPTELLSEYLYYSLATSDFRENGKKHLLGACGLKRLSKDYVNEYEIPLPPLPEQKRIVKELDALSEKVRQLQEIYTKQIANCDELKQAYLQKAFEGEL